MFHVAENCKTCCSAACQICPQYGYFWISTCFAPWNTAAVENLLCKELWVCSVVPKEVRLLKVNMLLWVLKKKGATVHFLALNEKEIPLTEMYANFSRDVVSWEGKIAFHLWWCTWTVVGEKLSKYLRDVPSLSCVDTVLDKIGMKSWRKWAVCFLSWSLRCLQEVEVIEKLLVKAFCRPECAWQSWRTNQVMSFRTIAKPGMFE